MLLIDVATLAKSCCAFSVSGATPNFNVRRFNFKARVYDANASSNFPLANKSFPALSKACAAWTMRLKSCCDDGLSNDDDEDDALGVDRRDDVLELTLAVLDFLLPLSNFVLVGPLLLLLLLIPLLLFLILPL